MNPNLCFAGILGEFFFHAGMPAQHENRNFRIFCQIPLHCMIQWTIFDQITDVWSCLGVPMTSDATAAAHYGAIFSPIGFILVMWLYLPKFSSIACLKQQLQGAGHIDPLVSSTSKKPSGGSDFDWRRPTLEVLHLDADSPRLRVNYTTLILIAGR